MPTLRANSRLDAWLAVSLLLLLSGCASYGVIENVPLTESTATDSYSIKNRSGKRGSGDIVLTLAFSGGGTRAAALAYGVLEELRDTTVIIDGQPRRTDSTRSTPSVPSPAGVLLPPTTACTESASSWTSKTSS